MGHPAQLQHLVVLESKDVILFRVLNVLLSKCYLILHNSLKLFGHSSCRIASENWDPAQEVVSTNMPPCPAKSMESHECGVCSGCVCNHQLHAPMLRPRGGEGHPCVLLRPLGLQSRMAMCRLCAGRWSRHPPQHQHLWLKQRYVEDEVGLAYKVVWRKYSDIPLFCKIT